MQVDLVIRGGQVVQGDQAAVMDVGIAKGLVAMTGRDLPVSGNAVVDAAGCYVLPGFIDVHSHTDEAALRPGATSKMMQGITTEICGQCGGAPAPLSNREAASLRKRLKMEEDLWYPREAWSTFGEFHSLVRRTGTYVNQVLFAGWWTIWNNQEYQPCRDIFAASLRDLESAFAEGVAGVSIHQESPSWYELHHSLREQIFRTAARHDAIVSVHLSDYGERMVDLCRETLEMAGRAGARVQISHIKAIGRNSEKNIDEFSMLCRQYGVGRQFHFDVVPSTSICTRLRFLIERSFEPGGDGKPPKQLMSGYLDSFHTVRGLRRHWCITRGAEPHWCAADLEVLLANGEGDGGGELVVAEGIDKDSVRRLIADVGGFVGTDITAAPVDSVARGTFPDRTYSAFAQAVSLMLECGLSVPRISSQLSADPAAWFALPKRGRIVPGHAADLVILEPADHAGVPTLVVRDVIIGGTISVRDQNATGMKAGTAITAAGPFADQSVMLDGAR